MGRTLVVGLALFIAVGLMSAAAGETRGVSAQRTTCSSFASQAAAQAAYRADPAGLANLDADHDGIACESNPCPCDKTPVGAIAQPTATAAPSPSPVPTSTGGATETVMLAVGCNNVSSTFPSGTAASVVFGGVSPQSALLAGWYYHNGQKRFLGYSPLPGAPNDLVQLNRLDALFICVTAPATWTRPTI